MSDRFFIYIVLIAWFGFVGAESHAGTEPADDELPDMLPDPLEQERDLSFWRQGVDWLLVNRDRLSTGVDAMARGIDRFFAGDDALDNDNKSYARIRFDQAYIESYGFEDNSEFKFRLRLPATQRKLKLVIENDSDEDETLEERNRPSSSDDSKLDGDQVFAALQVVNKELGNWKRKGRIGIKVRTPLNPFVRHTATRRWDLGEPWSARFTQELAFFKDSGYRVNEELRFERTISDDWFYRMKSVIEWREEIDSMRAAQVFSFFHRIDDKRGIEYKWGTIAKSLHHTVVDKSYLAIDYRHLLYEDWLYLDVIPEYEFPRKQDYESVFSFTVRLEILFFK